MLRLQKCMILLLWILVFLLRYRPVLIVLLIILDIFIARNIFQAKNHNSEVLAATSKKHLVIRISATPSPTLIPTPTSTLAPTPSPTSAPKPVPTTLPAVPTSTPPPVAQPGTGTLIDQLNAFRASHGLSPVTSNSETCSFASTRAQEITGGFDHSGFDQRVSNHNLPYPSYHEVTENIAMTGNVNEVISMWINSPGHNANMQKDTPYVCIMNSGNYYAYEGWRP